MGVGNREIGVNGAGSPAKFLSCLGFFLFCLMYIFIIIIIYECHSNRSFLLTRGMGRGGGGGRRQLTPETCRAGLGQCPLKDIFDLVQPFHGE